MRITKSRAKQVIKKIMSGPYDPTKADTIRIYDYYYCEGNKGKMAGCLMDVYEWLDQEPVCIDHQGGKLYVRFEVCKGDSDIFYAHYCYADQAGSLMLEGYVGEEDDELVDQKLLKYVKNNLRAYISKDIEKYTWEEEEDALPF